MTCQQKFNTIIIIMPKVNCCVPLCSAESKGNYDLKFYRLPAKGTRERSNWVRLLRNENLRENSEWTSVCSLHFRDGQKTYDINTPTIFPWSEEWPQIIARYNNQQEAATPAKKRRKLVVKTPQSATRRKAVLDSDGETHRARRSKRRLLRFEQSLPVVVENAPVGSTEPVAMEPMPDAGSTNEVEVPQASSRVVYYGDTNILMQDELQDLLRHITTLLKQTSTLDDVVKLKNILLVVTQLLVNATERLDTMKELEVISRFSLQRFQGSDEDIRFWTGFYSYDALISFYTTLLEEESAYLTYWGAVTSANKDDTVDKCGRKRQLDPVDEMFLTLVKLRQGSANKDLAERFGVGDTHASRIFITWVNFMHGVLTEIDIWMSRGRIKKNSPQVFKHIYNDVRVIIDCTEVFLERPSDFEVQAATYSTYKSSNTLKGLIGISPNGIPTFVSDLFEGSISDNQIVYDSGLVQKLEPYDAIMADRGFTAKEALAKHHKIRLVTPHFLHDKAQMDIHDLVESVAIARVRIHVERMMGRIKQWQILCKKVPITYWKHINHIFQLCTYMVLFWPPLNDNDDLLF